MIASPIRDAIGRIRIFLAAFTASVGKMESVMTSDFKFELWMRETAPPESTPCVMYAQTSVAPDFKSASAALTSVPPLSMMSSIKTQLFPRTSPITFMTSDSPGFSRRLSQIAMGTSIGDTFDLEKMRYHKIVIATDADVDGAHITTLILTLYYRYFRAVIDAGYLYIAQPPLYKIKKGKEIAYAYSDAEKNKILGKEANTMSEIDDSPNDENQDEVEESDDDKKAKRVQKTTVQRYKGLGEMNSDELWDTTMDPNHRVLKLVTIHDAEDANATFDMLMGSEVAPRKAFIQSNAKLANLDV